jgi:tRNA (guanine6-N2)-methyltransferase
VRGLEWVAADEISSRLPGARGITLSGREVAFRLPALAPAVLALRTVDDVLGVVGRVPDAGPGRDAPPLLARRLAGLDWAGALAVLGGFRPLPGADPGKALRLDVVASLDGGRRYNRFAVEQAVGASLAPLTGGCYLARTSSGRPAGQPDLTVRVLIRGSEAVAAVQLGPRPLHRRGYKTEAGAGTLHPPAAAALARLAGLAGLPGPAAGAVADPFCGDGTIVIESLLAGPGEWMPDGPGGRTPGDSGGRTPGDPGGRVLAGDLDPVRLGQAGRNAARAGVAGSRLAWCRLDAGLLPWAPGAVGTVITNPPWNLAVDARGLLRGSLDPFWDRLAAVLAADGRLCVIADAGLDLPGMLRGAGYQLALATRVRLAGRVSHVLLAGPPGGPVPAVPAGLAAWRQQALADGVIRPDGF